jgi:flagellar basal-body rod modification protein FlgD
MSFISPVATDSSGNAKTTGGTQSLGKNDFLQLLVTKLQNQDPLNPSSDESFIAELAQFSSLEQMNNIAEGITTANKYSYLSMQSINNSMASSLIGKTVEANYSNVYVTTGDKPTLAFTSDQAAQSVTFTIEDADGNVIDKFTQDGVSVGTNTYTWDGTDSKGNTVSTGYYTVSATCTTATGGTFQPDMTVSGVVDSVVYKDNSAYVKIGTMEIALGDIKEVGATK